MTTPTMARGMNHVKRVESAVERSQSVPTRSLALRMFPRVFPLGMNTAPGEFSEGRFAC
jgi:hypothetical protein